MTMIKFWQIQQQVKTKYEFLKLHQKDNLDIFIKVNMSLYFLYFASLILKTFF